MPNADITELLRAHREGEEGAFERLVPLVYDDLRRVAHFQLVRQRPGATLNTTALVHEAYLKLVGQERLHASDRVHFLAIAARAMRQVIVDHAKSKATAKRGAGQVPLSIDALQVGVEQQADFLVAIDQSLTRMTAASPRLTRVFECRYFGGLTEQETSEALAIPLRTVQRDWMKSKAWLQRDLVLA